MMLLWRNLPPFEWVLCAVAHHSIRLVSNGTFIRHGAHCAATVQRTILLPSHRSFSNATTIPQSSNMLPNPHRSPRLFPYSDDASAGICISSVNAMFLAFKFSRASSCDVAGFSGIFHLGMSFDASGGTNGFHFVPPWVSGRFWFKYLYGGTVSSRRVPSCGKLTLPTRRRVCPS